MRRHCNLEESAANRGSRMIAEIINKSGMQPESIKNGASPKSHTIRGNNFNIL